MRQDAFEPVIDEPHDVEAGQLGIGLDADDAALDRRDHADRQAGREDAAGAARHDAVARFDLGLGIDEDEARPVGIVAVEEAALVGPLDRHRDMRVEVGEEKDARGLIADLGDAADEAFACDRGLAARHAVASAGIDQHAAQEGAARIGDDPRRDLRRRLVGHELGEVAQRLVLGGKVARHFLPLQQALVLFAQRLVLAIDGGDILDLGDGAAHRGERLGDDLEHWRHEIGDRHARLVEHQEIGLAEHGQHAGAEHQHRQREALCRGLHRGR